MDQFLYIIVAALTVVLIVAQLGLAVHQLKKGLPDGKPLLIINAVAFVIWIPLCIFRFTYPDCLPLDIVWFVLDAAYMIFAIRYTSLLGRKDR